MKAASQRGEFLGVAVALCGFAAVQLIWAVMVMGSLGHGADLPSKPANQLHIEILKTPIMTSLFTGGLAALTAGISLYVVGKRLSDLRAKIDALTKHG